MRLIDISSYQENVDFHAVKASGVAGVCIKATEGVHYVNSLCASQARGARAAGLRVGFYHYARPNQNRAAEEAECFASVVARNGGIGRRDLRPVLDMEFKSPDRMYVSWSRQFNRRVKSLTGTGPLFYSYAPYIAGMHPDLPIGYGLWLASYGPDDGHIHPVSAPRPWKRLAAHQFTSNGVVPGVNGRCDVSEGVLRRVLAHPVRGAL